MLFFVVALAAPPVPIVVTAIVAVGLAAGLLRLDEWRFQRGFPTGRAGSYFSRCWGSAYALRDARIGTRDRIAQSLARPALAAIALYVFFYTSAGPGRNRTIFLHLIYWAAVASAVFACVDFFYQLLAPAGTGVHHLARHRRVPPRAGIVL